MKISDRKIDPQKKEDGAWVENIPNWENLRLKTRGVGNRQWARMEMTLLNGVPRKRRFNGLELEDRNRINGMLLRDTALLDWANMEDEDGNPLPYSRELADKYLTSPEYEPFRDAALYAATFVAEQGENEIEDDAKN